MTHSGDAISYHELYWATPLADKGAPINSLSLCTRVCLRSGVVDISKSPADMVLSKSQ